MPGSGSGHEVQIGSKVIRSGAQAVAIVRQYASDRLSAQAIEDAQECRSARRRSEYDSLCSSQ